MESTCKQPCLKVSVDSTSETKVFSFVLRYVTSVSQNIYFESIAIKLNLICGQNSTDIDSSMTRFNYVFLAYGEDNTLQFD